MASTSSSTGSSLVARSGAKPPSSPTAVDRPRLVQDALEHVVGLGAPAQRLAEAGRADRHDHELLEVHAVVGVDPAVQHVHHRHGQHVGVGAADGAVQRDLQLGGRRLGRRQRHAEDGVGPEAGLVVGAVEVDHRLVDGPLVEGVEAPTPRRPARPSPTRPRRPRPCRRSGRRRRAARPPRTGRSTHPTGTAARPRAPLSSTTSTSTVGLPRESRISRPTMCSMVLMMRTWLLLTVG